MINAYDFISVIFRRDALDNKEKGLSEKFIIENNIKQPHYDEQLICIMGGMNAYDVEATINWLVNKYGLVFDEKTENGSHTDIVVVDFLFGIITNNNWIKSIGSIRSRQYYFEEEK